MAHMLVVDDERSICELLEITFRKEGHRVEVALNGENAKRRIESQVYDLIISDIKMPDTNGVELLKLTREVSPSTVFVLITGVPTVETAIAAVNAAADRYVIKDHNMVDHLRRTVAQVSEALDLKKEAGLLRRELRRLTGEENFIGHSAEDARDFRSHSNRRPAAEPRNDHRRERHRKRTRRARNSSALTAREGALHHHRLRRVS